MGRHESEREHCIRSWLEHIDTPGRLSPDQPAKVDSQSPWRPHHLLPPEARPMRQDTQSPNLFVRDSPLLSISSASRASESRYNDYGKKPRRKTRPDRYESRKRNAPSAATGETRSKKRRKEKERRLRSEREVMDNFASHAIASDRLTPKLRPGSFLNGRSSVAAQPADLAFYHLADVAKPDQGSQRPRESRRCSNQSRAARDLQDDADFFANVKANKKKHVIVIGSDRVDNSDARCSGHGTSTSRPATASHVGTVDYGATSSQRAVLGRSSISTSPLSVSCQSDRVVTPVSRRRIPKWRSLDETGHQVPPACADVDARRRHDTDQEGLVNQDSYRDQGIMVDTRRRGYQDKGVMVSPGLGLGPLPGARRRHDAASLRQGREAPQLQSFDSGGDGDAWISRSRAPVVTVQSSSFPKDEASATCKQRGVPTMPGLGPTTHDGVRQLAGYDIAQSPPALGGSSGAAFMQRGVPAIPGPRPSTHDGVGQFGAYDTLDKLQPRSTSDGHRRYQYHGDRQPMQWPRHDPIALQPPDPWQSAPDTTSARAPFSSMNWKPQPGFHVTTGVHTSRDDRPRSRQLMHEADESPQELITRLDREARHQVEASSRYERHAGEDGLVDWHEVDLQPYELDRGESVASQARTGRRQDPRDAIKPRTRVESATSRPRRWDGAYDLGTVDLAGFWRPNYLG
ncbi:hypothetical protein XA68_16355 [Ophiocordyceps unilateralis]|uniref:Uncharacterized protein n=1 Tax=Ophiocordyceps unilateralis TaxID=268505 RepID=A0A2A9P6K6_OPHUN|nr:hypothetical protein XA68_16355 [Ophiocordyceps unilateralis]